MRRGGTSGLAVGIVMTFALCSNGAVSPALEQWWRSVSNPPVRFGTRDFYAFALEAAAAGAPAEWIEQAVEHGARKQDRNPASRTYGNLAWYWGDPGPEDLNCVEFSMQRAVLLWKYFRGRLSSRASAILQETFHHAAEGVRRHRVSTDYSNIFLKKTWNCIALGEVLGRADLAAEGYQMLDRWIRHTLTNGVTEYLSPTYYAVNLENLGLIARHSTSEVARMSARAGMDFLWLETAAHWFPPAGRLGGPHSRDYDALRGIGGLNRWAARAGWPSADAGEPSRTPWFHDACWVAPPPAANDLVARAPRMVRGRWRADPAFRVAQWVGRRISLGTSGAAYEDSMDKVFVVLFSGMERVGVSFLMDARGDPYGKHPYRTGGGHMKAHHVYPFVAAVQRGPEALLLASANASDRSRAFRRSGTNLMCWLSHWVLPADLPLYIGAEGGPVAVGGRLQLPRPTMPVFLREGDAAAGIRFVWGTAAADGGTVEVVDDGSQWGARRLTWVHSTSPPAGRQAVAVYARVAEGLDDRGFDDFRRSFASARIGVEAAGDHVRVEVSGAETILRVCADLAKEERRELVGEEPWAASALLAVDGAEIGASVLRRALR
ncbi:MAG: hypothetical protein N2652_10355 [Kiritimatiellae bacterium]|nr:hypothetical protein [Kiritimatiellia bacterium]